VPAMAPRDLSKIRAQLDAIDRRILDAIADRHDIIEDVAQLKADGTQQLRDMLREEGQLTELVDAGRARGLDSYYVTQLFNEILDHSVRFQQEHLTDVQNPERKSEERALIAFQGADGAYSQIAAEKHFAPRNVEITSKGYGSFAKMLEAVASGEARYGMLPVENTTAGSINEAYDLLAQTSLAVIGEELLHVEHCLVALPDATLGQIRSVFSHPQALAQCSVFLSTLQDCTIQSFTDTAASVKKVRDDADPTQAAIASERAAQLYGLSIIARNAENQRDNFTRFMVVSREAVNYDLRIPCKSSLILATKNEEGALLKCLNVLAEHGLNLSKLESRPRPNVPWEYLFYVDVEGNSADPKVREAFAAVEAHTSYFKALGSYPARTTQRPAQPKQHADQ
jgi:chorismate mutase/prephenate dehydratase